MHLSGEQTLLLNFEIMLLVCFSSALLLLKFIGTTLPNCSDDQEVEKFILSPQYLSLYSLNANISKKGLSPEAVSYTHLTLPTIYSV